MFNLVLAVHDQGEGRSLHSPDRQDLSVLSIFQRVETGGIHPEQPVAVGSAQSGLVEGLELRLILQVVETLADGFFSQGGNP